MFTSQRDFEILKVVYPPEIQLWSFCLCSGHSVLVNFSETSHVTVLSLDVLYRAHSGLLEVSGSLTMATFNLVKHFTSLWKYDHIL